jgi:hypothetical protein
VQQGHEPIGFVLKNEKALLPILSLLLATKLVKHALEQAQLGIRQRLKRKGEVLQHRTHCSPSRSIADQNLL